jgi:hypothetical protein
MNDADESVQKFLDKIDHPKRRRDAITMLEMMRRVTGEKPRLWRSAVGLGQYRAVGFGQYHYKYKSGREGDAAAAGFAPGKAATTVYVVDGVGAHADLLEKLGPHTTGVVCIYIKDLEAIDIKVLEAIVARSYAALTSDTYTLRAREGGHS